VLSGGSYYVLSRITGRFAWSEVKIEGVRDGVAGVVSGVNLGQKVVVEGPSSCIACIGSSPGRPRLKRRNPDAGPVQ